MLEPVNEGTETTKWINVHRPISVSVCSNVPGFTESKCFVNENADSLLDACVQYLANIAQAATNRVHKGLMKDVFKQLEELIENLSKEISTLKTKMTTGEMDMDDQATEDDDAEEPEDSPDVIEEGETYFSYNVMADALEDKTDDYYILKAKEKHLKQLIKVRDPAWKWTGTLPCVGFNSAKYDIPHIRTNLVAALNRLTGEFGFVTKKNGGYMTLERRFTEGFSLKFLDASNFVAAGCSYSHFLSSFGVETKKGFWPYEYLTSFAKLQESRLPPKEAFFSSMKDCNVLEEGFTYNTDLSAQENESKRQKQIDSNYKFLQDLWRDRRFSTLQDLLEWYNNLDVRPLLEACLTQAEFYRDKTGIDCYKEAISAPGIARHLLMSSVCDEEDCTFSLFSAKDRDLHETIDNNIVGGPSIIFHRHHKRGETKIRGGEKTASAILGYDASALYLWSTGQEMPVSRFQRRREETGFEIEKRDRWNKAYDWLAYRSHTDKVHIRHGRNGGEVRIGPYKVDGFATVDGTPTVYDFKGCFWHGHDCHLTESITNKKLMERQLEKYTSTRTREAYIRSLGHHQELIWDCEYEQQLAENEDMGSFVESLNTIATAGKKTLTQEEILELVKNGTMFGAAEMDIKLPEHLRDKFSEMTPIFKNATIQLEDVSDHMREFFENHPQLSTKPRRCLIGSMWGEKILVATPLLQWYLNHGLEVTRVYQTIEWTPSRCFSTFVDQVSNARRAGDADKSKAILADTMKLLGNSSYGGMIMNKATHTDLEFVNDTKTATKRINSHRFRRLEELGEDLFEVESSKTRIHMNLPRQLGFFILNYAKLRMLQFYYDFIDKYVDRADFQLMEMDTDSNYFALSADSLEDVVKPELKEEFEAEKHNWLPRTSPPDVAKYDKRTPGLFKIEYWGTEMICLQPKTYIVYNERDDDIKFSCKGAQKKRVKDHMETYRSVLESGESRSVVNKGFRIRYGVMYTYCQERKAFGYEYWKRKLLPDTVSTTPLDI